MAAWPWRERRRDGRRALAETAIGRVKANCDGRLHARTFGARRKAAATHNRAANRQIATAKPTIVRLS